jgi:DNA adenine methylase
MNFYLTVRDSYPTLQKELEELDSCYSANRRLFDKLKTIHPDARVEDKNEEMYYHLRAQFNGMEPKQYSDAALYYYINKTAYSGMIRYNTTGEFNVPFGRYSHLNSHLVSEAHSRLLQRAEIFSTDFSEIFSMCKEDDFMFLDPPYDCIFSDYGNVEYRGGFDEREHERLASAFYDLPCKALMVIGKTPLIEALYRGSIQDEYRKSYAVNIRNRFKAGATHVIVANYRKDAEEIEPVFTSGLKVYPVPEIAQPMLFDPHQKKKN